MSDGTLSQGPTVKQILGGEIEEVSKIREVTADKKGWKLRTADYRDNMKAFGIYTDNDEFVEGVLRMTYDVNDIVDAQQVDPEDLQEDYDWIRRPDPDFDFAELTNVGEANDRNWNGYS